ncbi:unnamed protein product [Dibothriocephalus latus]|uniref:Peptidase M1 membrane alanine aminopeptidase domain-containing protein n=1 Tax=Dibothriocephalus latus TaxID=60516 RepID=A0A3P7LI32_DIBLA|nr:unnamed protein product [Dibothriocephalus latus]
MRVITCTLRGWTGGLAWERLITIIRRNDYRSLSNMPLARSVAVGGTWIADEYHPTLNTSTYLLAFVVSQFSSLSGRDSKDRNFTIWARPDLIGAADYALKTGKTIINFFEEYFELDYPLNKTDAISELCMHLTVSQDENVKWKFVKLDRTNAFLFRFSYLPLTDMLAVPHFAAGAMENWGLLIYREATLIWDPVVGTEGARQKVATVISHEIAHQVFKLDEQFAVLQLQKVLLSDSLATTHPVFMPVYHPDEINEIFDTISYNKVNKCVLTDTILYFALI